MHCIVGELCSTAADSSVWVFWYPYWPFQAYLILSHYLCECTTKSIFFWISILWDIGIYLELSVCVEWKNVIINGSLITSVTMSMGTFRTEPLFYSSGATDVHVRAAGYVSSSSKSATSSWIGGESLYIDTYILFSRIHSFIIYQISLTDCKVCIHQCSNLWENNLSAPYHNLFNSQLLSLCSLLRRSCMVHDICILHWNYWCFIGDNEWSFSSVSWFNHTGKKIGKYWQVSLNSWLTN